MMFVILFICLMALFCSAHALSDELLKTYSNSSDSRCILGTQTGCSTSVASGMTNQIINELGAMGYSFQTLDPNWIHCSSPCVNKLQAGAANALKAAAQSKNDYITINSAYRSSAGQYLLYNWYLKGICGIGLAAKPGTSNHEGGRAVDTSNYNYWLSTLGAYGWVHSYPSSDPVHFDYTKSRVWDGHRYVVLYHVAYYDANTMAWLPLQGGKLGSLDEQRVSVNTLAWDPNHSVMYIGGMFHTLNGTRITPGIVIWTKSLGIIPFPGGGVSGMKSKIVGGCVTSLAYEPKSDSLFVTGNFSRIDGNECFTIAVWNRFTNRWTCLHDPQYEIFEVTAMTLSTSFLYLAGWAATTSSWLNRDLHLAPYAVARLDVSGYIDEHPSFTPDMNVSQSIDAADDTYNERNDFVKNEKHRIVLDDSSDSSIISAMFFRPFQWTFKVLQNKLKQERNKKRRRYLRVRPVKRNEAISNRRLSSSDLRKYDALHMFPALHQASFDFGHTKRNSTKRILLQRSSDRFYEKYKTASPTIFPTHFVSHWEPHWQWLPDFIGGNGPILRMTVGTGHLEDCLIISGAFNNYPAVVLWKPSKNINHGNITTIGKNQIQGVITSVKQAFLPFEADTPVNPAPFTNNDSDYTLFILLSCVSVGVVMGLTVAVWCFKPGYIPIPQNDDEIDATGPTDTHSAMAMSLVTLSDGHSSTVDFRSCFERAMRSRHLPIHEALVVINPREIVLSRIIGEGSFGRVWSGQWRNNAVAVKEFVFAQAAIVGGSMERNNIIEEIVGEAGVMACLRHPKILQLYGCSLTMQAIWIVSELCTRGSLRMILNDKRIQLPLIKKLSISMDIADGMLYLHNRSIIHRDLKSHNVFITEPSKGHFVAKIGDWGSARAIALKGGKSMTHGVGTACWLSPEVINNAHFSKLSDVYAYGIVLWEIFTRQDLYEGLSAPQIIAKVAHEGLRPQVPRNCPWERIMTDCWKSNPDDRPGFHNVLLALNKIYSNARTKIIQNRLKRISQSRSIDDSVTGVEDSSNYPSTSSLVRDILFGDATDEYIGMPDVGLPVSRDNSESYNTKLPALIRSHGVVNNNNNNSGNSKLSKTSNNTSNHSREASSITSDSSSTALNTPKLEDLGQKSGDVKTAPLLRAVVSDEMIELVAKNSNYKIEDDHYLSLKVDKNASDDDTSNIMNRLNRAVSQSSEQFYDEFDEALVNMTVDSMADRNTPDGQSQINPQVVDIEYRAVIELMKSDIDAGEQSDDHNDGGKNDSNNSSYTLSYSKLIETYNNSNKGSTDTT